MPNNSINRNDYYTGGYGKILTNSVSIFRQYVLNAKYIDYPVIGLTKSQLNELNKWMSDRYNENILIAKGYLYFNMEQKDEDCFVLEPYLVGQYQGNVRNNKKINWDSGELLPTFKPPTKNELHLFEIHLKNERIFRRYKFGPKDFLWQWNKYFIKINKQKNILTINCNRQTTNQVEYETKGQTLFFPYDSLTYKNGNIVNKGAINSFIDYYAPIIIQTEKEINLNLSSHLNEMYETEPNGNITTHYMDEIEFSKKNQFGKMGFVIVGQTALSRPIVVESPNFDKEDDVINKVYLTVFEKR